MSLKKIQDIKIPSKKTFETIKPKEDFEVIPKKEKINFFSDKNFEPVKSIKKESYFERKSNPSKSNKKYLYLFFALALFGFFIYLSLTTFNNANITIKEKHQTLEVKNIEFLANKGSGGKVPFEIMSIDFDNSVDISLQDTQNLSKKATGTIVLYNEYSKNPIKLKSGTFLSDKNGKTYTLDTEVSIPFMGSVDSSITAFLDGESYNSTETDFFINDFKKDKIKYSQVYAKAKNEITGGFAGQVYVLNEDNKKILEEKINSQFKTELVKKMNAQVPFGYILYQDAVDFNYNIDDRTLQSKSQQAEISIKGSISGPIFKKKNLEDILLRKILPNKKEEDYKIIETVGIENLAFNFPINGQNIDKETQSINFNFNGNVEVIWHPDSEQIKNSLFGKTIPEAQNIFRNNEGIDTAVVKIFPPFSKKIPLDPKKVSVKIE